MARFREGQSKLERSGRRKGVPNRKTLILTDALDRLGHDLPTKIVELLPKLSPEKQMETYLELMQYAFPKRKAVEFTHVPDPSDEKIIIELVAAPLRDGTG